MTTINPSLSQYLPASYKNADGSLKPGIDQGVAQAVALKVQEHVSHLPAAEQGLFLSLMASATNLAPQGGGMPDNVDGKIDGLETAAASISSFMELATDVNILGKLMIIHANESRKEAMDQRLQARESAKTELLAQAGQDHDAADKMRSSAVVALVMSVVSVVVSAISIGFAVRSTAQAGAKLNSLERPEMAEGETTQNAGAEYTNSKAEYDEGMQQVQDLNNRSNVAIQITNMASSIGQSLSGYFSTTGQADAKEDQAKGEEYAALAQDDMAKGDQAKEVFQAADDLVKQIINLLKDLKDSKAQEMASITRG